MKNETEIEPIICDHCGKEVERWKACEGSCECCKDMYDHLFWLAGMLDKTSDFISEHLLEKQ